MDRTLQTYMKELLSQVDNAFQRYKYNQIDWNLRLVCLTGPRGVGKSTMVLQHIANNPQENALYVSADHSYFTTHTLIELADEFVKDGGEHLYIDEVHKYTGWSRELKQIYDTHPGLKVFVTGSSILDLLDGEADLSRRMVIDHMYGLSLREYLKMVHHVEVPIFSLQEILEGKAHMGSIQHPLPYFKEYLRKGYYPFTSEGAFYTRLEQIIRQTVEADIVQYAHISLSTGRKILQMLRIMSANVPYKPEAQALANELKISRNVIPDYLAYLERAGMIGMLRDNTCGMRGLGKMEKVYIDNTNMLYAMVGEEVEIGNLRETFFYNQTRVVHNVAASRESDFCIGNYTFEVGGRKKGKKQIQDIPNSFVVRDDIEYAVDNIIPLWAFGLMY